MSYGLYLSADGALAQSQRMEIISNNLANVETVGFKRDLAVVQARFAEGVLRGEQSPGQGGLVDVGGGVQLLRTQVEQAPGRLRRTGEPTDAAIDGDGFFLVRKNDQTFLTRAGNFVVAQGELQTPTGHTVLDASGGPIPLAATGEPIHIAPDGAVVQGGARTPLALVRPAGELQKAGGNLLRAQGEPVPVEPGQRRVRGGYLEYSTVQPTTEMLDLIEASRAFEANAQLIRIQDQILQGLVNRVLRV